MSLILGNGSFSRSGGLDTRQGKTWQIKRTEHQTKCLDGSARQDIWQDDSMGQQGPNIESRKDLVGRVIKRQAKKVQTGQVN